MKGFNNLDLNCLLFSAEIASPGYPHLYALLVRPELKNVALSPSTNSAPGT